MSKRLEDKGVFSGKGRGVGKPPGKAGPSLETVRM